MTPSFYDIHKKIYLFPIGKLSYFGTQLLHVSTEKRRWRSQYGKLNRAVNSLSLLVVPGMSLIGWRRDRTPGSFVAGTISLVEGQLLMMSTSAREKDHQKR